MKSKIKFQIQIAILRIAFLILMLGIGMWMVNSDSENQNPKTISESQVRYSIPNYDLGNPDLKLEIPATKIETDLVIRKPCFPLEDFEREIVCYVVAGEAKGEPMEGKMAVAQCYMNAMIRSGTSVAETRIEYQYSGYDDKLQYSENEINKQAWADCQEAVSRVFDNGERVTDEFILWFHSDKVNPKFHKTQKFVIQIGHHLFYSPWEIPENAKPYYEGEL